ncbi:MAG: family 10 glycosylhydrolase, partial [Planctomycetaceae bacterium]|nr:family 10 glycosylhydrolase [Planctomycetaceae bacterium]
DMLQVFPRTPRIYDGVDLRVQAPDDAKLVIELTAPGADKLDPIEIPLTRAVKSFAQLDLDGQGNRLLARRTPGDGLAVALARDSLVFAPGEKLELEVQPRALDLDANTTYELETSITPARSDEEIASDDYNIKTNAAGECDPIALSVPLPQAEGVYDFKLALIPKRLTSALIKPNAIAQRKVQVVVVALVRPIDRTASNWKTAYELDPANSSWWERMARMPTLRRIPNLAGQQLASGPTKTKEDLLGRPWIELAPRGWQAYPLAIESPGQPHVLEVEYASDFEQTLGISLVEPNAAGQVQPIGLDSGVEVPAPAAGHKSEVKRHRLLFWPRTRSPWVLLTNRRDDRPALVGKINVLAGPLEPPALAIPPSVIAARTFTAYFDRPLLAENFSAGEVLDPATGRVFDDWLTFYEAGKRMVSALKHGGYNAVVLSVVHEGGALYPSQILGATPKYDTGIYFESGQDPIRKDVLELILRLCDRAGIQVIPAVQLTAPIPELEAWRLAESAESDGIEPIGKDGRSWIASHGAPLGQGVYYNALDDRVQKVLRSVVAELAARYGQHASFGGVAMQWTAQSYAILPDETASYDDKTIALFEHDTGAAIPIAMGAAPFDARDRFLHGAGAKDWLAWRQARLTAMYRQMQADLARVRRSARLYLLPADLLGDRDVQQALRPMLPPADAAQPLLARLGIDTAALRQDERIVLPRPYRVAAGASEVHQSLVNHWNQSADLDAQFAGKRGAPAIHYHEPSALALPAFDSVSPFGADKTYTWLLAQISPADAANRQRLVHSIAVHDSPQLIDGGALLPLGQEQALAPLIKVFRRLPAEPFATAQAKSDAVGRGIVVRSLSRDRKTWFYVVNDTPWSASVEIDFAGGDGLQVISYADERPARIDDVAGGLTWSITLAPYDLAGGELNSGRASVADYRAAFLGDPAPGLIELIRNAKLRINTLPRSKPREALANPSFQAAGMAGQIPGWVFGSVPPKSAGAEVSIDQRQGNLPPGAPPAGQASLHLVSRPMDGQPPPIVWVRSEPFELRPTGRAAVFAWIRVADQARQPQLRLAIEGKHNGQVYYQWGTAGLDDLGRPAPTRLSTTWTRCHVSFPNLPEEGLTDVRVGFDLMGAGEVWIDDVEVFDFHFDDAEHSELLKSVASAQFNVQDGRLGEGHRFVTGYWPNYLSRYVPLPNPRPQAAFAPPKPAAPANPGPMPPPEPAEPVRSSWDPRTWNLVPKWWR